MSVSSNGRSAMSKAGIIEEVVTPMIKHLEIAEEYIMRRKNPKSDGGEIKKMFENIKEIVVNGKAIIDERKKWEGDVIDSFSIMERHVDNILEDNECDTYCELMDILSNLQAIMKKITPSKEHHEEKSKSSNHEKGESSKTGSKQQDGIDDSYVPFIGEIMNSLDPQLRHCLYCLTIFPENAIIKRRLLVYWWIGLKLVRSEQIGGLLFDDLVNIDILIPYETRKHNNIVDKCTVEPIVHKKLISSYWRERFIINEKNESSLQTCTIRKNNLDVGTILNVGQEYLKSDVIKSNGGVKRMMVMQVGQWRCVDCHHIEADKTDFLNEVIPDLTYLSLQNISRITELPESIGNSTSLMILDVRACHNLEKLPPKIKILKNLTHLDVSMCYLLDHIPRWISNLYNLEVFKGFVIGSSGNKNRCRLSDISRLLKLRKLSINIGHDSESAKELNSLKNLSGLRSLTITWGIEEKENGRGEQEKSKIMEPENPPLKQKEEARINALANTFPKDLEKLDLRCFPNVNAPDWLNPEELKNLKRLYIRGGKLAELRCSKTDSAWEVKTLRLRFLKNLKEMKRTKLKNLFPSMEFFEWEERDEFGKLKGITVNEQKMDKFYEAKDEYLSSS
ncbi:hypothetical protein LUZ60_002440 [Juncus effusus]|nr:hypothetical protein LUZ60_002440 [Juncus effusus]